MNKPKLSYYDSIAYEYQVNYPLAVALYVDDLEEVEETEEGWERIYTRESTSKVV